MKKIIAIVIAGGLVWLAAISGNPQEKSAANSQENTFYPQVVIGKQAPDAVFTALNGKQRMLAEFRGKKVMFWLLATWCPSCIVGTQVLGQNNDKLRNLTIIGLKTYGNAGYPGPSIKEFANSYAPQTLSAPNWLWGDASKDTTNIYNPRNYPDIYFLIDENGVIRGIDGAPAATIDKIIQFANKQ